jgi:type I restriction enzyme S subunit
MKLALKPVAIGEVVERSQTWNPSRSSADEVFQYIDLSAVDQDAKLITGAREVSCGEAPSRARQLIVSGDILVSTVRPNLNGVARVPEQLDGATASTGFCVLRANKAKANGAYLFHWVKSPDFITDMVSKATGASYPAVSDRIIFDSQIPLPPLAEQKRIAAILDAADALRTKRRESLAQLDALLQSTFLSLFGDPVANPMGWEVAPMASISEILTGFAFPSGKYLAKGDGIALCRGINVGLGSLSWDERVDWSSPYEAKLDRYELKRGDIILAMDRPWISGGLKAATVTESDLPSLLVQRVARIRANDLASQSLLYSLIKHPVFERHCRPTETTIPHISPLELKSFPVILPPLPLQQKFAAIVESVERQKAAQRAHLAELDALFAALQHRAFRGEL